MTTAAPTLPPPKTAPVQPPTLVSSLLTDEVLDSILTRVFSTSNNQNAPDTTEYLTTGVKSLDTAALGGGLEPARVVEIAGAGVGGGVSEIYKALLVSFLTRSDGQAAIVDTTGNFDVLGLYGLLVAGLKRLGEVDWAGGVEEQAAKMLERVKIMRVFDFEGVREAVGEIVENVEGRSGSEKEEGKQRDEVRVVEKDEAQATGKEEKPKRTYVADSEDEDDEEEEMLFESETKDISVKDTMASERQEPFVPPDMQTEGPTEVDTPSTLKFILIDNLTQVLSPLLKNDLTQATLQTTTLLSTLANLTHTHALYTFLITPTTSPRPASPTRPIPIPATEPLPPPPLQQEREPPASLSIFSSNKATGLPALSALMGLYADVRLMVSRVPKRRGDARLYYSDESVTGTARKRGECVGVLEVVGDRWGVRTGGWGVFGEAREGIFEI